MKTTMYGQIFNVHFMWDMTPAEFSALYAQHPECTETYDYLGAVFFGDFKLEFIQNADGGYRNLFLYDEDETGPYLYDYLEDGTPYGEYCDEADEIALPLADSFDAFASAIEAQIINLMRRHIWMLPEAANDTEPNKWYPGDRMNYARDITREA